MNIKKNLALNTLYQILNLLVPLITAPYLSRVIGAEGIGIYAYYNSIAYYFILFIMLGLNNYGNRTIARIKSDKELLSINFSNIYALQFIVGIIGIIIYILFVFFCVHDDNKVIAYINVIYVLSALFDINWLFSGLEKFSLIVMRNTIIKVVSLICIFIYVKDERDLPAYVFILAVCALVSQLSTWPFLRKVIVVKYPTWKNIKIHIVPNIILFIPVIAMSLYKIMDKIMLGILSSKVQVGYYENSEKIINIPQALINSLGIVMLPRISALLSTGENEKTKMYTRDSMQYALWMGIAVTFGLMGISYNFSIVFFGEEFAECGRLISALAPTLLFNVWANVIRTQYLIPLNRDKSYIASVMAGAIVNLIINGLLIKPMGAMGAVIGTVLAELTVTLVQTIYVRNDIEIKTYVKDNCFFVIPAIIMYYYIQQIDRLSIVSWKLLIIQILGGALIYLGGSWCLLKLFTPDRFHYIKNSFFKRSGRRV